MTGKEAKIVKAAALRRRDSGDKLPAYFSWVFLPDDIFPRWMEVRDGGGSYAEQMAALGEQP